MKIQDLGVLDTTLLLFGGPYSNLQALEALIQEARNRRISPTHMICTGDVVAYCADAAETCAAIRAHECPVVAGNCEKQLAENAMDCGCGFETGTACDLLSAGWYAFADKEMTVDARTWMRTCPDVITFTQSGRRHAVIHGGITDISRFLWPTSLTCEFQEEIAALRDLIGPIDMIISGHSGLAFTRMIDDVTWINAGVIGMPPNDGTPETRFVTLENGRAQIHKLRYDHLTAQARMVTAGLIQGYHTALSSGIWPSQDVLPENLRSL